MATKLLELTVGRHDFLSATLAAAAPIPRIGSIAIHMEAIGLWRSPLGSGYELCSFGPDYCRPSWLQTLIGRRAAGSCFAGGGTRIAAFALQLLFPGVISVVLHNQTVYAAYLPFLLIGHYFLYLILFGLA